MSETKPTSSSVRARLLEAADELFYPEGIHTVGIDRLLEHAGVAKASLYKTFGSKDELVRAYLERKAARLKANIETRIAQAREPRERILAVFAELADRVSQNPYKGCAFVRASSDLSSQLSSARTAATAQRKWLRDLFTQLATEAGLHDPEYLSRQLTMIYDGATTAVWMDDDPSAARAAQKIVQELLTKEEKL